MKLFFNQVSVLNTDCAARYSAKEFASPTRSTVPLLDALQQSPTPNFFNKLLSEAGMDVAVADLRLEYQVKAGRGRGKASHTDLMATQSGPPPRSLAIEAKWTEPRYETVAKWLGGGTSPENRREVLHGWLKQITPYTKSEIRPDQCEGLVYQMVHRAASAVAACKAGGHPSIAYLVFHDERTGTPHLDDYRADLCRLRSAIGNKERFPFFLTSVSIHPTDAFRELEGLKKGCSETSIAVRRALASGSPPLFDFSEATIEII